MRAAASSASPLRQSLRVDWSQIDVAGALRCSVGVLIPLVAGTAAGYPTYGVWAAIGSLCAGFASFQAAYRRRAGITLIVGAGMAAATITGGVAERQDWTAIAVVSAWALVVGMMSALSPAALVVGLQWGVAAIIINALVPTTSEALLLGAMVLGGAAVQTILVVAAWPIRTYRPERLAVAAVYRELATVAAEAAMGDPLATASTVIDDARQTLSDPHPLARLEVVAAFQGLIDEAARMRLRIVALATLQRNPEAPRDEIATVLMRTASKLKSIAGAVVADAAPHDGALPVAETAGAREEHRGALESELAQLTAALEGELRSASRMAEAAAGERPIEREAARPSFDRHYLADVALTMRANLSWQSATFRHTVRLATALAAAMIIGRLSGLPHGYWIALTALLVLRQDYATTTVRGLSRIGGTVLGALVATLLVVGLHPGTVGLTVLFAVAAFLAFVIVRVNYGLFSVCVTAYVVFLLAFAKEPALSTAVARLENTLIGGAVALVSYLVWPTWQARLVGPQLSQLLSAQADHTDALLSVFADPDSPRRGELERLRSATRRARTNAQVSVERMASEPRRSRREALVPLGEARAILAAGRRISISLLALQAALPDEQGESEPAFEPFRSQVVSAMRDSAELLRGAVPTATVVREASSIMSRLGVRQLGTNSAGDDTTSPSHRLRDSYRELCEAVGTTASEEILVLSELDELVDAVDSARELAESHAT